MTTIVWSAKERILATDSRGVWEDHQIGKIQKLYRLPHENSYIATAGDSEPGELAVAFFSRLQSLQDVYQSNRPELKEGNFNGLLVWMGVPYEVYNGLVPIPIQRTFHALGTGGNYAVAAMALGVGAIEAVKFAAEFDIHTDTDVQWVKVNEIKAVARGRKRAPRVETP